MNKLQLTYRPFTFRLITLTVISALMFFIGQGNSMFITEVFADKFVEVVDTDAPTGSEERNQTNNNNQSEEDHLMHSLFEFISIHETGVTFYVQSMTLYTSEEKAVTTPPPRVS